MELNGHPVALSGLVLYVVDVVLVGGVVVIPLLSGRHDDDGDGIGRVVLPQPRPVTPFVRFFGVLAVFAALSILYAGIFLNAINHLYGQIVGALAAVVLPDPTAVGAVVGNAALGTRFLWAALFVCMALTIRASPGRRAWVAAHTVWYLAAMVCVDAGVVLVGLSTGIAIRPFGLLGNLLANLVGITVFFRFLFTTLQIPRPTVIPRRASRLPESTVLLCVLVGIISLLVLAVSYFRTGLVDEGLVPVILSVYLPGAAVAFVYLTLAALQLLRTKPLRPSPVRPPLDVITPAYNEEERLPPHLQAIDEAARRYGGRVHVVVCDDGSSDTTREVAEKAMRGFAAATGEVLTIPHAGKSAALNAALARGSEEIVVRVDADVEVGADAFVHTHGWFQDPVVGMVGALNLPSQGSSWFHRMREFECLLGFGFGRRTLQTVDGIVCVPGTFTAFRRHVAAGIGGFVDGMNGEDADLTMSFGRLGYRVVLDPALRVYEDVPPTLLEFREQRLRWNRAGVQIFARHAFFRSGFTGPRSWFTLTRVQTWRALAPTRLMLVIQVITLSLLAPSYRAGLLLALSLPLVTQAVMLPILIALCIFYRRWRPLPFVLSWWAFFQLRRVFMIEGMFTLPSRAVRPLGLARAVPRARSHPGLSPAAPDAALD